MLLLLTDDMTNTAQQTAQVSTGSTTPTLPREIVPPPPPRVQAPRVTTYVGLIPGGLGLILLISTKPRLGMTGSAMRAPLLIIEKQLGTY